MLQLSVYTHLSRTEMTKKFWLSFSFFLGSKNRQAPEIPCYQECHIFYETRAQLWHRGEL